MKGKPTAAATEPGNGASPTLPEPWASTVADVLEELDVEPLVGLSQREAARRLALAGPNELRSAPTVAWWRRLLAQVADPVVYLLLAAIVISAAAWIVEGADGLPLDSIVIAAIVVANGAIGYLQERRAERAMAALQDLTKAEATVVRDGEVVRIAASWLAPGDIIELHEGDVVPADARMIESSALRSAEAALTGESAPVLKASGAVPRDSALGDRASMVHSGTAVASGRGRAVVTATGLATEVGRIATLLEETESRPTPLRREVDWIGRILGITVVVIAAVVVVTLLALDGRPSGEGAVEALLIGVALAVAAVPEGLPAVLSVVLALGVQRMSERNALVKRLASVETLGSATVICSDKTGTLTRNEMSVRRLLIGAGEIALTGAGVNGEQLTHRRGRASGASIDDTVLDDVRWALTAGALASDESAWSATADQRQVPDPTEAAILAAQAEVGIDPLLVRRRYARQGEVPFTPERKRMSTISADADDGGRLLLTVKGAPDVLLDRCRAEWRDGRVAPLSPERRQWWLDEIDVLAGQAYRTLAVATRSVDRLDLGGPPPEEMEDELVLAGVFGIIDPPRTEAREAVEVARHAGVRVAMVTGDHPSTARRIAADLGIAAPGDPILTSQDITASDDEQLAEAARSATVYARVTPEQKLRIVHALTSQGEIVAMTGDGVNDAPALKAADIGIAMGVTGTDVSKEAADMILADDNFATIVAAVSEGRAIFHNIRSVLRYLLSSNIGEVFTVFGGVVAASAIGLTEVSGEGPVSPLLAVQILWINLVTDAGPALALGVDPPTQGLMDRPPRGPGDRVVDRRMWNGIVLVGLTMAVATLFMLDLRLPGGLVGGTGDLESARTAAFTVLVLAQLFNTFNARSDTVSVRGQVLMNRWLLGAVALSLALQVAIVHLPFLNSSFGTVPLTIGDWALATVLASSVVWVSELRKLLARRR